MSDTDPTVMLSIKDIDDLHNDLPAPSPQDSVVVEDTIPPPAPTLDEVLLSKGKDLLDSAVFAVTKHIPIGEERFLAGVTLTGIACIAGMLTWA